MANPPRPYKADPGLEAVSRHRDAAIARRCDDCCDDETTGWQQHSVRGFLAGVVRKRLKLKLGSKKVDGIRVYQIAGVEKSKRAPRKSERLIWRRVTEL